MFRLAVVVLSIMTLAAAFAACSREDGEVAADGLPADGWAVEADLSGRDALAAASGTLPALGFLGHRGQRYRLRDVADHAYRAESDDEWVRGFPFDSAMACGPGCTAIPVQGATVEFMAAADLPSPEFAPELDGGE